MHRSVSQLTSWLQCGEAYRLQRIEKVPQLQAGWFAQGTATHVALEGYEKSGRRMDLDTCLAIATEAWQQETADMYAKDSNLENWLKGGKKSTEQDLTERFAKVQEHVAGYIAWCETNREHEWLYTMPDGTPASEVSFELDVNGVRVIGAIDLIIETPKGLIVRDIKTGTKIPPSPIQLAVYRWAVERLTGILPYQADYFMTKDGKPSKPVKVDKYSWAMVESWFKHLEAGVQNNVFPANPGECFPCTVKNSCTYAY
ncbi:RecB family exonuclease [Streptomyces sp. NPDC002120]|uniref:RecB family exonuclease n=1 Tax=Streptomyces sp. NPDC002120 TaxID=3364631 RepID=UPI0036C5A30C